MAKWEYAVAEYDGSLIDPHSSMSDIDLTSRDVLPFLAAAGEKGWEMCGVLPVPALKPKERDPNLGVCRR